MGKLTFVVAGVPQPKGSGSIVAGGRYIEAGTGRSRKRKVLWYARVADTASRACKGPLWPFPLSLGIPVAIEVRFQFPIPASRARGKRRLASGDPHVSAPDTDKLCRALGDSLTRSGVIVDDRLIHSWVARKVYCEEGEEGAYVTIAW